MAPLHGTSTDPNVPGVLGENSADGGRGVVGNSSTATGIGVLGQNGAGVAVYGNSGLSTGVWGESQQPGGSGVLGENKADGGRGVVGNSSTATGIGVLGQNGAGDAVTGNSGSGRGVYGKSASNAGVLGESGVFDGVFGISHNPAAAGVSGHNPGGLAGFFEGNATITGTLTAGDVSVPGADCAEQFDIIGPQQPEAGTVVVIDREGALRESREAYDKKVAGVVSGAGNHSPGIVLDKQAARANRLPIALVGKVYCKVDTAYSPIEVGDLLTTSPTPGHAMRAGDPLKAFGAVIGKALRPMRSGCGLIPILIALQ
jgi:hypothetical protein